MEIIIALIIGLLPSLIWLFFFIKEDPHPEPKKLILITFIYGALSTFVALGIQLYFNDWASLKNIPRYGVISFFVLALIEEILKFGAAYLLVSKHPEEFDEAVDAMVYMVVAALGFATVENIAAAINLSSAALETTTLRFIGATLLHTLSSGLLGYYWAVSIIKKNRSFILIGMAFATLLHTVFNLLIINFGAFFIPLCFLIIYAVFILYDFEKLREVS